MKFTQILAATAIVAASATLGSAATYSLGDVSNGANTSNTLVANTVDYYTFSIGDLLDFLDFDTALSSALSGIDTEIGLYNSLGQFIATDDDGATSGFATRSCPSEPGMDLTTMVHPILRWARMARSQLRATTPSSSAHLIPFSRLILMISRHPPMLPVPTT